MIRQKYSLFQRQLLLEDHTSHKGSVKLCNCDYWHATQKVWEKEGGLDQEK